MKKYYTSSVILAVVAVLGFTACSDLKDKIFQSFTTSATSVDFTINIVTSTTAQTEIGTLIQHVNIDSIIKAETGDAFSLDDISSINVEEVKITIKNPDVDNNFANFEDGSLLFHTNTDPTPVQVASGVNPDVFATEWLMPVDNSINLKNHLKGTEIGYVLKGKARRVTTKPLDCVMAIKFKIN